MTKLKDKDWKKKPFKNNEEFVFNVEGDGLYMFGLGWDCGKNRNGLMVDTKHIGEKNWSGGGVINKRDSVKLAKAILKYYEI